MKIEDLQETAQLAHLTMDDQALIAAFPAFEQILGFFAAMEAADHDAAAFPGPENDPTLIVTSAYFRQDNPDTENVKGNLLPNAGDRDGQFVVVPNVL